jgi:glutamate-ammonia-ligase adenylyltransferase
MQIRDLPGAAKPFASELERQWQDFKAAADAAGLENAAVLDSLPKVWACSPFVAKLCVRTPGLLFDLEHSGDLERGYPPRKLAAALQGALATITNETALHRALRLFRQREMLRIAWRDIAGWADLAETTRDLSDLADAAIKSALACLYAEQCKTNGVPQSNAGEPQQLIVLAMGKLGAHELNFSSDIDLIFAYPEGGETQGAPRSIDNQQFFEQLGRRLIKALNEVTPDGFVFRVDMRLRPFGDSGPLVGSFAALEQYYEVHARDWERYAMIKARVAAGDPAAGACLMAMLEPFVYRRYLDFGAFESLREMKRLVEAEVARKGLEDNIKLGPGGIREIEFIGQAFQLIRGGRIPALRQRPILTVLHHLQELGYLPAATVAELKEAYVFLRNTEHRIQQLEDKQTQMLPRDEADRQRVALGMGFEDWTRFAAALEAHRQRVARHFARLLESPGQTGARDPNGAEIAPPSADADLASVWNQPLDLEASREILAAAGLRRSAEIATETLALRESTAIRQLSERGRERLDKLMPRLLKAMADVDDPGAIQNIFRLLSAIARRSVYLSLLTEYPEALHQLIRLFSASPWIAAQIAAQPILLDELLDPRRLYAPPGPGELEAELFAALDGSGTQDLERNMETLRHFKHAQVLRVAAADITGELPLAQVSNHLAAIADTLLRESLMLVWQELIQRHGTPYYSVNGQRRPAGLAIVGYGKLGGFELGYGSDLDLIFLHDSHGENAVTDGPRPLDNAVFFTRLSQRIIHVITALTAAGRMYEIDARLRPNGNSGLLVSSMEAFRHYQLREAWTWEHQALIRARTVAGDLETGETFEAIRREVLSRARDPQVLRTEIVDMREKMRGELDKPAAGRFHLKHGRGGIVDIEFMVQYAVLRWAAEVPKLLQWTDNLRLLETLAAAGLVAAQDGQALHDAYFAYRAIAHRCALQDREPDVAADELLEHRQTVSTVWQRLMIS